MAAPDDPQPRRGRGDGGAVVVELVIITPVFFMMMMFLVQLGLWLHAVNVASSAAQEAASVARAMGGTSAAAEARANEFLGSTSLALWQSRPQVNVTYPGDEARVEIRGVIEGVVPLVEFRVFEVSQGPVERFRGPGEEPAP